MSIMGKIFGIIALICGILGIFGGWLLAIPIGYYGIFVFPGIAIVAGIIGIIVDETKGMAIAGLILGLFGIVFVIFILPLLLIILALFGLSALFGSLV